MGLASSTAADATDASVTPLIWDLPDLVVVVVVVVMVVMVEEEDEEEEEIVVVGRWGMWWG